MKGTHSSFGINLTRAMEFCDNPNLCMRGHHTHIHVYQKKLCAVLCDCKHILAHDRLQAFYEIGNGH